MFYDRDSGEQAAKADTRVRYRARAQCARIHIVPHQQHELKLKDEAVQPHQIDIYS
jgi:hypothetical protein